MSHEIESFTHYGRTVRILVDEDGSYCNPRENDGNLTTILGFHKRYKIGDTNPYGTERYAGWDDLERAVRMDNPGAIILPLYMLDHSGTALSTTPFACPWDSGRVGFVLATRAKIKECYGWARLTPKRRDKIHEAMRAEVAEYGAWCNGEVYGYTVSEPGDPDTEADSCWGFIGFDYVREAAKEAATPTEVRHA